MNAERYEAIGQLFHRALELPPETRSAFLRDACGADEDLRQEVESLLSAHRDAGDFVAGPAANVAAEWLARYEGAEAAAEPDAAQRKNRCLRSAVAHRPRRHGRGVPGARHATWPQRRGQAAPVRAHQQLRRRATLRAGSARRLLAQPPEHRHHLRDRRPPRAPLHRYGVRGRTVARRNGRPSRRRHVAGARGRAARAGALGGARGGNRAPRYQARERDRPRGRLREGARLRYRPPGPVADRRQGPRYRHQSQPDSRHAALYVARAGTRRDRDGRQRCVLARRRSLRARHGHAPIRIGVDARHTSRHHVERRAEPNAMGAGDAANPRAAPRLDAREASGGAAHGRRGRGGARETGGRPDRALRCAVAGRRTRAAASRPQPAVAAHGARRTSRGARWRHGHAAPRWSPAVDADRTRWDGKDAPGDSGGRRSRRALQYVLRGRRVLRQPRADCRSATRGLSCGTVARCS